MKVSEVREFKADGLCTLRFLPVEGARGYSHRIVVDGKLQESWLPSDQKPTKKSAIFYIRVWAAMRDGLPKYHYVDRCIDPPPNKAEEHINAHIEG